MTHWRDEINGLKPFLNKVIDETHKYNFKNAKQPAKAQIWTAVAILAKQLYDIEVKLKYLERALQDIGKKGMPETREKIEKDSAEVEKVFRDLLQGKLKKKSKPGKASKNIRKTNRIKTNF